MANDFNSVIPQILAQGLMALRENAVTAQLVNRGYSPESGTQGSTVDVPVPSAVVANAVSPSNTPPTAKDSSPTTVPVVVDQWYEAPFHLTDRDMAEAMTGIIPMQASEAIKSLINIVDLSVLGEYKNFYGAYGTAGTTPFGSGVDLKSATQIRKILNKQLAPLTDRRVVFDPDAEAAALELRAFNDGSYSGDFMAIREGQLNRKLGFEWWMNQNTPTHTAGTAASMLVNGTPAVGATTLNQDGGTGTLVLGDLFTIAGDPQYYVVTAENSNVTTTPGITFAPGLQAAPADNAAITVVGTHVVNLAFHRDAIAFASRPLQQLTLPGSIIREATDPVSRLTLRLEVTRQHKQTVFSYDMLWGTKTVRPALGARLLG